MEKLTKMTKPRRPKLTLTRHAKSLDDIVPLPQIEQGLDRTRKGSEERQMAEVFRRQAQSAGTLRGDEKRIAVCENGDGKGTEIAAFLNPVCSQFDLDEDSTADLAAFTRKLMKDGKPRRGSQARQTNPFDTD